MQMADFTIYENAYAIYKYLPNIDIIYSLYYLI